MGEEIHKTLKMMFGNHPDSEFSHDLEYMPTMDEAWHQWLQPKWDKERTEWLKKQGK